ncbi:amino acid adenylation domain-containing protein [Pantoea sp. Ap-967]|uniref:non-ribosomal peptide synthetase n=1 Tax=Pantoea sp. Ap-967 TaxID=2608362 RepID=UPI00141D7A67|nr:non-ribosomal peptide synthetase [Pantoea sp. Ap-967]NIE76381.1 amino acid adenylation domain-containing protein [Pantoea sp. Ap-967]
MNAEKSLQLARRFIELPLEKRRLFLDGLAREGIDFSQFPIPEGVAADDRMAPSFAQRRMWVLWQLDPQSGAYNLPGAVRLSGALDEAALQQAFNTLIERHQSLACVFVPQADESLAQVLLASTPQIHRVDLSALAQDAREAQVQAEVALESQRPFDLQHGPLLRIRLLHLAQQEHVLLITLHHIVSDGWSMNVLIDEFSRCYDAFASGVQPNLPPLPIQYVDYALWQRRWLEAGELERQLAYWQGVLGEEQPVLELPLDHPRPASPSFRGNRLAFAIDTNLAGQLRSFARQHNLSLFMLLLAGFGLLLQRYTGQADLRIGSPVANRNRSEIEGLIGLFVNTQVLRLQPDAQGDVLGYLSAVRQTVLGAQAHQDLPFERLVDALKVERSLAHAPLFQVMYNHQPQVADLTAVRLASGLELSSLQWRSQTTQFDLSLDTFESAGVLQAAFTYASDLFDEATVQRMAEHWQTLLHGLIAQPQAALWQLPMLDSAAVHTVLHSWNATARDYPLQHAVHQLIEQQVQRTPQAPALVFCDATLSYAELDASANRLAHYLRGQGAGCDRLIGISVQRSVEMVVGLLAVLKAGAAYVPLDPDYPEERLAYMIEDSGIDLLLTQQVLLERLPVPTGVSCVALDRLLLDDQPATALGLPLIPNQLAYVIYTSGSTGRPKGAGNSHAALTNRLCWMQQAYGLDGSDAVLQKTPFSFDVSVWEFFWPLMAGARLVVAAPGEHRDPARLIATIGQHQVTTLHFVPSMLQAFIHEPGVEACTSLRQIVCSGEALPVDAQQQVFAKLPQASLYNLYGPTEAAIDVTHWTCVEEGRDSVPIGQPIANIRTYVLDAGLEPVAPGVAGELYLGGVGLARGYHRRPGLTAERFVADPFVSGTRLYRTGDRVRQRPDGVIEYLGRFDHQVKIRGLRIELGEIEARLAQHPSVREAVVLAVDARQLVAYLVLNQQDQGWQQVLKDWLLQALPEFMVPSHLLALPSLPLTPNGKLDRKALPQPQAAARGVHVAPVDETQRTLAEVWCAVLGVEKVGIDDNFFELGGDSIIAIQVVSRARRHGLHLSPRDLFQYQTVRSLAGAAGQAAQVLAEQGLVRGEAQLSPIQRQFFTHAMPMRGHWNQSLLLAPRQMLEPERLAVALAQLLRQHDALNLRFSEQGGGWQAWHADTEQALPFSQHQVADEQALTELCEATQRSLDLNAGPLLRAVLAQLADGSQRLLLVIHHLVVDGVSWRILLEDLQQAYLQAPLPAKTSAWQAWAARLPAVAERHADELDYWTTQTVAAELPCDNPQGVASNRYGRKLESRFDAAFTRQLLQQAPAAYRTQVNDLLLTALAQAVADWSGQAEVLVQLEGHGREEVFDDIDLSRTVGWFTTLYPVRLNPSDAPGSALKVIKEQLRGVPHKGLGHGLLQQLGTAVQRDALSSLVPPRITFNYLGQFDQQFDEQALWAPALENSGAAQDADAPLANWLSVEGQVYQGELSLQFGFSSQMYQESTVVALMARFQARLSELVAHCCALEAQQATPSDFPLVALDQATLDALPQGSEGLADLLPLSPMQQGLLYHSLLGQGEASYINQMRLAIEGLEPERFRDAWQATLQAHPVLRSGFAWDGLPQPLQRVQRQATLPFECLDWRGRADHEQALQALALQERERGFDLREAPLLRLVLVRLGEAQWVLIYTHHHLLMDGWSNGLLLAEVLRRYSGLAVAAPLSSQRDYIAWLQAQDGKASEAFWREHLAKLEAPTRLVSQMAGNGQSGQRADLHLSLGTQEVAHLEAFAKACKVTFNTLVQAAWLLLLQRYTGQASPCFGATVAGRPSALVGIEQQIGLFINTLPVIATPQPQVSLGQWLEHVQLYNLAVREHEYTPLADIQRWAGHAGEALFDTLLVFENYPVEQVLEQSAADGLRFGVVSNLEQTHYPLTLMLTLGRTLELHFNYDRGQISDLELERVAQHLKNLLTQLPGRADTPLAELSMLGEQERQCLLVDWNADQPGLADARCVHQLIEQRVRTAGDAIALIADMQALSYEQLDRQANQVAHRLIELGVGPEVRVGVALRRTVQLPVALLGVLKAGGAYVPLDPDYPTERVAYMLEDSQASVLVTEESVLPHLPGNVPTLLMGQLADYPQHSPCTQVTAGNLAYVIYTSGSTGRPKGVAITHRNVQALVEWTARVFSAEDLSGVLASTSVCFDLSVWELFVTLALGGKVILARNALELAQLPARDQVRLINSVPSAVAALARAGQIPAGVHTVNLAGEPLKQVLVDTLYASGAITRVNDLYGPSEDTTYSTWVRRSAGGHASIGRPLSNSSGYVLDDWLQPVPSGLCGELYLGGAGITRGYLLRPSLTAERFVPDPFGSAGERLYRTGDLVRLGASNDLEYQGRIDHQVKIRGLRIELGEIEARLLKLAGVREAVVVASDEQLVAYLVGGDQLPADETLRDQLRRVLPEYMVPAQLVRLEQLPLTPNGKLDRKALPAVRHTPRQAVYRAPQSSLEQQLAALWCDVLQQERVGLDDDFFELGGHSLQLVMLQTRVRGLLGMDVTLKQLQGLRTLGDLATYLRQMQSEQGQDLELDLIFGALDELEKDNA